MSQAIIATFADLWSALFDSELRLVELEIEKSHEHIGHCDRSDGPCKLRFKLSDGVTVNQCYWLKNIYLPRCYRSLDELHSTMSYYGIDSSAFTHV